MDKKWLLILDVEMTIQEGRFSFILQEIEYDNPLMFMASDEEAAIKYCIEILGIKEEQIG